MKKHIIAIEQVQRRFTKRVAGLFNLPYSSRLHFLNLPSMWWRFTRGSLITTYKILRHNFGGPSTQSLFRLAQYTATRGHPWKLDRQHLHLERTKNFFFNRIIPIWNSLPQDVISSPTVNLFKNKLDLHIDLTSDLKFKFFE